MCLWFFPQTDLLRRRFCLCLALRHGLYIVLQVAEFLVRDLVLQGPLLDFPAVVGIQVCVVVAVRVFHDKAVGAAWHIDKPDEYVIYRNHLPRCMMERVYVK